MSKILTPRDYQILFMKLIFENYNNKNNKINIIYVYISQEVYDYIHILNVDFNMQALKCLYNIEFVVDENREKDKYGYSLLNNDINCIDDI